MNKFFGKWNVRLVFFFSFSLLLAAMALQSTSKSYTQSNIQHEQLAQQLSEWGLFSGTGEGFELAREATRAEAVVMLLRLLGQEQQALEQFSSNIAHPFQDVLFGRTPIFPTLIPISSRPE